MINIEDKKTINISKKVFNDLRLLSIKTDKFLYELVEEATELLKEKVSRDENVSNQM